MHIVEHDEESSKLAYESDLGVDTMDIVDKTYKSEDTQSQEDHRHLHTRPYKPHQIGDIKDDASSPDHCASMGALVMRAIDHTNLLG